MAAQCLNKECLDHLQQLSCAIDPDKFFSKTVLLNKRSVDVFATNAKFYKIEVTEPRAHFKPTCGKNSRGMGHQEISALFKLVQPQLVDIKFCHPGVQLVEVLSQNCTYKKLDLYKGAFLKPELIHAHASTLKHFSGFGKWFNGIDFDQLDLDYCMVYIHHAFVSDDPDNFDALANLENVRAKRIEWTFCSSDEYELGQLEIDPALAANVKGLHFRSFFISMPSSLFHEFFPQFPALDYVEFVDNHATHYGDLKHCYLTRKDKLNKLAKDRNILLVIHALTFQLSRDYFEDVKNFPNNVISIDSTRRIVEYLRESNFHIDLEYKDLGNQNRVTVVGSKWF